MEVVPNHPLLQITQEDIDFTRNMYNINDVKMINESIDAVIEWMEKQAHLAESSKHITRQYIERIFWLARGSTEGTKKKIDKLFTIRAMIPEMCLHRTPGEFDKFLNVVAIIPLPKLVPKERSRVVVTKILSKNIDDFSFLDHCRYTAVLGEYRLYHEYNAGDRLILDFNRVSILSKISPVLMKKIDMMGETYGVRVKGVHIINAPPYIDTILSLLKSTLREKVASRLHVHNSYEELYEHIDKSVLPEDYGGDEISISKLAEKWKELLNTPENIKLIADQDKLVSDESKRSVASNNQDVMGMPGSFRKLNVD